MSIHDQQRPRIFTWHVHGSYLYYLSQGDYDIFIPVLPERIAGYYGRGRTFPFGANVVEIPAAEVRNHDFDIILFQSEQNYLQDQFDVLSEEQRLLPRIYLEHNTPLGSPVETQHPVREEDVTVVHVTHFNKLVWNNGRVPVTVIEHGVTAGTEGYNGHLEKGLTLINHLPQRGRALGWDIFRDMRKRIPLDLAGMGNGSEGIGEVLHPQLPAFRSMYRFYFHPVRHTSLALAVCESMMQGIPVIGLATTELSTVIRNGENGYIHTNLQYLEEKMTLLLRNQRHAWEIGDAGRQTAEECFGMQRFTREWEQLFRSVITQQQHLNATI
ncbi:glycosyltransferase [Chitinophaga sp. YIM B06452]|uniref:glycosyltransferase n=1 Tax=Chitinophaga sp. YIM B06452 TaxID=3082158 RepID=UPI0031FF2121